MVRPPRAAGLAEGWSDAEVEAFNEGMKQFGKDFGKIQVCGDGRVDAVWPAAVTLPHPRAAQAFHLPARSVKELIGYYYDFFKMSNDYQVWKQLFRPVNSHLEFEFHGDECEQCKNGGSLLCCDSCNLGTLPARACRCYA